jgi:putative hydrolase of the HAD superfamily
VASRTPAQSASACGGRVRDEQVSRARIRNVVFDFGGVLVRWKPQEVIDRFYADDALRELVRQAVFEHPDWVELDRGTLTEASAVQRFSARMGRPREEIAALVQHAKESLTPIVESVALAQELSRREIPLYGLSNVSAETFAFLRSRYDFWALFRGIVTSFEVKRVKPEPEIFEHLCRVHGLRREETAFIDDHPPNVEAASRLGFRSILFCGPAACAAELETLLAV